MEAPVAALGLPAENGHRELKLGAETKEASQAWLQKQLTPKPFCKKKKLKLSHVYILSSFFTVISIKLLKEKKVSICLQVQQQTGRRDRSGLWRLPCSAAARQPWRKSPE